MRCAPSASPDLTPASNIASRRPFLDPMP